MGGGAEEADGAEGEAVAGHGVATTGSATGSLGSSPLVPASRETSNHTSFYVCRRTEIREQQDHFLSWVQHDFSLSCC